MRAGGKSEAKCPGGTAAAHQPAPVGERSPAGHAPPGWKRHLADEHENDGEESGGETDPVEDRSGQGHAT